MAARPKRVKPSPTARAQAIVRAKGWKSLSAAARESGLDWSTLNRALREGLSESPKQRTVEALRAMGLLPLVQSIRGNHSHAT